MSIAHLVLTPIELSPSEAFDFIFIDHESDERIRYWSARTIVQLSPSEFTALAMSRFRQRQVAPRQGDDFAGRRRGIVGAVRLAMKTYQAWDMPPGFNKNDLSLTTTAKWHVVTQGEAYGWGTSYTTSSGAYISEVEAHTIVVSECNEIIADAEFRKIARY